MTEPHTRSASDVVVTGVGIKAPGGLTAAAFWDTVVTGASQAARIERFDPSALPVTFGCEVKKFDAEAYVSRKEARRLDRVTQLGVAAAADAYEAAGDIAADPARCAVVIGTGVGGMWTLEDQVRVHIAKGPARISPFFVPMMMPNATAGALAMRFGWTGPSLCIATACAAGANAIGEGARLLRNGAADVVITGGTEAVLTPTCIAAFARMTALSGRNDEPHLASRPFDAARDGFVMGEGAAALILERRDHAENRGADILGVIAGYASTSDAYHITAPSPGGEGAAACMSQALADAKLAPDEISHINAHGTSTPLNDAAESEAIAKVFGEHAPPVTSTKGVTGHLIGAAGAVEAVTALLSIRAGLVPPTANLDSLGDDIHVDVVAGSSVSIVPGPAISNSFGFGGHNATLVLSPA